MSVNVSGTEGYAENASSLISRWQSIAFVDHHMPVLHLIPDTPSRILDVGSGIGTDAVTFAAMGHSVVAVEPVDELRVAARNLHPARAVEWLDGSLPDLAILVSRWETFDLVILTAVWMHLDEAQRRQATTAPKNRQCQFSGFVNTDQRPTPERHPDLPSLNARRHHEGMVASSHFETKPAQSPVPQYRSSPTQTPADQGVRKRYNCHFSSTERVQNRGPNARIRTACLVPRFPLRLP